MVAPALPWAACPLLTYILKGDEEQHSGLGMLLSGLTQKPIFSVVGFDLLQGMLQETGVLPFAM